MTEKMPIWRFMNPDVSGGGSPDGALGDAANMEGQPSPFVSTEAATRYNQLLLECYEAQLAWRTGS
jgi:hypothetical protein